MDRNRQLKVNYDGKTVGTLALYKEHIAAFQYSEEWLAEGFSISPFSLPISRKLFVPKVLPFDGLFGVFSDSLPDGWGRNWRVLTGLQLWDVQVWELLSMCRNITLKGIK